MGSGLAVAASIQRLEERLAPHRLGLLGGRTSGNVRDRGTGAHLAELPGVMHAIAVERAAYTWRRDTSSGNPKATGTGLADHIRDGGANPNDYACVLLLMVPSCLWLALSRKAMVVRVAMFARGAAGIYMI